MKKIILACILPILFLKVDAKQKEAIIQSFIADGTTYYIATKIESATSADKANKIANEFEYKELTNWHLPSQKEVELITQAFRHNQINIPKSHYHFWGGWNLKNLTVIKKINWFGQSFSADDSDKEIHELPPHHQSGYFSLHKGENLLRADFLLKTKSYMVGACEYYGELKPVENVSITSRGNYFDSLKESVTIPRMYNFRKGSNSKLEIILIHVDPNKFNY